MKTIQFIVAAFTLGLSVTPLLAQEPVVVDEQLIGAMTAETPPPIASAESAMDPETQRLQNLMRQIDTTSAERQLLEVQRDVSELTKGVRGATTGTGDLPVLVGLSGSKERYVAEFMMGDGLMQASDGDWVSSEWRVERVHGNGVTLRNARGSQTHTMLLSGGSR